MPDNSPDPKPATDRLHLLQAALDKVGEVVQRGLALWDRTATVIQTVTDRLSAASKAGEKFASDLGTVEAALARTGKAVGPLQAALARLAGALGGAAGGRSGRGGGPPPLPNSGPPPLSTDTALLSMIARALGSKGGSKKKKEEEPEAGGLAAMLAALKGKFAELKAGIGQTSSAAQVAASQMVRAGAAMTGAIDAMGSQMAHFVQLAQPGVFAQFSMALENMKAAVGSKLVGALSLVTRLMDGLNRAITSLSGPASEFLGTAALAGTVAAAVGALAAAVAAFVGPEVLLVGVLAGAAAAALQTSGALQGLVGQVSAVANQLGEAFNRVLKAAEPAIAVMGQAVGGGLDLLTKALSVLAGAAEKMVTLAAARLPQFLGIFQPMIEKVGGLVEAFAQIVGPVVQVIGALQSVGQVIMQFNLSIVGVLLDAVKALAPVIGGLAMGLSVVTKVASVLLRTAMLPLIVGAKLLGAYFERVGSAWQAVFAIIEPGFNALMAALDQIGSVIDQVATGVVKGVTWLVHAVADLMITMAESFSPLGPKIKEFRAVMEQMKRGMDLESKRQSALRRAMEGGAGGKTVAARAPEIFNPEELNRKADLAAFQGGTSADRTATNTEEMKKDIKDLKNSVAAIVGAAAGAAAAGRAQADEARKSGWM